MPAYSARDTKVKIASTEIGELKQASVDINGDEVEVTPFGSKSKKRKSTLRDATMSMSGYLDPDDAGQAAVLAALMGAEATGELNDLSLMPLGDASGVTTEISGDWIVKRAGISGEVNGAVEVNFEFASNGDITYVA